jgi:hypothetical protein
VQSAALTLLADLGAASLNTGLGEGSGSLGSGGEESGVGTGGAELLNSTTRDDALGGAGDEGHIAEF